MGPYHDLTEALRLDRRFSCHLFISWKSCVKLGSPLHEPALPRLATASPDDDDMGFPLV